jgi:hypothetical protein
MDEYIHNYYKKLRIANESQKAVEDYDLKITFMKQVGKLLEKHPEYIGMHRNGGIQSGGGITEVSDKLTNLFTIIEQLSKTKLDVESARKINQQLDQISEKISIIIGRLSGNKSEINQDIFSNVIDLMETSVTDLTSDLGMSHMIKQRVHNDVKLGPVMKVSDDHSKKMELAKIIGLAVKNREMTYADVIKRIEESDDELKSLSKYLEKLAALTEEYNRLNVQLEQSIGALKAVYKKDYNKMISKEANGKPVKGKEPLFVVRSAKAFLADVDINIKGTPLAKAYDEMKARVDSKDIDESDLIDFINQRYPHVSDQEEYKDRKIADIPYPNGDPTLFISTDYFTPGKDVGVDITQLHGAQSLGEIDKILSNIMAGEADPVPAEKFYTGSFLTQQGGNDDPQFQKMQEFYSAILTFEDNRKKYEMIVQNSLYHTTYLALISVNHVMQVIPSYRVFTSIGRGMINYYHGTVIDIVKKVNDPTNMSLVIQKMRTYYIGTLVLLNNFMIFLMNNLGPTDTVDIEKCSDDIRHALTIFNHFRGILDSYGSAHQNKTSVYCRINDFNTGKTPNERKWLSTYQSLKANEYGPGRPPSPVEPYNEDIYISHDLKNKTFYSSEDMMRIPQFSDRKLGTKVLFFKESCNDRMPSQLDSGGDDGMKAICFTEVFDTQTHPTNDALSAYMNLSTQLSLGHGSAMMTYGYSGVGKSFTLFGGGGKAGILQSTLAAINGLDGIMIRVFELYGIGVPYVDFWKDDATGNNSIVQWINAFRLEDRGGKLGVTGIRTEGGEIVTPNEELTACTYRFDDNKKQDTQQNPILRYAEHKDPKLNSNLKMVKPKNKIDYEENGVINEVMNYVTIKAENVNNVFKSFDKCVEEIEHVRENRPGAPSVRRTPNNPVSSRSMIVYDIQAKIIDRVTQKPTYVPFMIIDLPGRESIVQTYVDVYLGEVKTNDGSKMSLASAWKKPKNKLISDFLEDNNITYDGFRVLRGILSAAALNPMMMPLFVLRKKYIPWLPEGIDQYKTKGYRENQIPYIIIKTVEDSAYSGVIFDGITNEVMGSMQAMCAKLKNYFDDVSFDGSGNIKINKSYPSYIKDSTYGYQYEALLACMVIGRIITHGKFDLLFKIIEKLVKIVINDKLIEYINGIGDLTKLKDYLIADKPEKKDKFDKLDLAGAKTQCIETFKYDFIRTPYEGIYINENIIGLLSYLVSLGDDKGDVISGQDESIINNEVVRSVRSYLRSNQSDETTEPYINTVTAKGMNAQGKISGGKSGKMVDPVKNFQRHTYRSVEEFKTTMKQYRYPLLIDDGGKLGFDMTLRTISHIDKKESQTDMLDFMYHEIRGTLGDIVLEGDPKADLGYKPDRTYRLGNTLAQSILGNYVGNPKKNLNGEIDKCKLFYLLSNNDRDLKCHHQRSLLEVSTNFIEQVVEESPSNYCGAVEQI